MCFSFNGYAMVKQGSTFQHTASQHIVSQQLSLFSHELSMQEERPFFSLGIDEAGRGCLAGPVVAAAVLLPPALEENVLCGLDDSKKLKAAARQNLAEAIRRHALAFGLGLMWQADIDRINILQATFHAMSKAAVSLLQRYERQYETPIAPMLLHIDGNKTLPSPVLSYYWHLPRPPLQEALVGGDGLVPSISAASIMAKTFRDKLMKSLHRRWPQYNFAKHKGYGTKEHLAALRQYGPCPLHRMSFGGVCSREAQGRHLLGTVSK